MEPFFFELQKISTERSFIDLLKKAFTGEGDFEDYLQQFTTAARLSGWQTAATDNRLNYSALRLKGNALHFYTTLTVAQQQNFDQLVAAFRTTYSTNVEVRKAKLKAARQQPNQTIAAFLVMFEHLLGESIGDNPSSKNKCSLLVSSKVFMMHNSDENFERVNQPIHMLLWPSQWNCMLSWKRTPVSEADPRPQ